jgi:hypothetical protein
MIHTNGIYPHEDCDNCEDENGDIDSTGDRRDHTSPITAMMRVPVFKLQEQQQKLYFGTNGTHFIVNPMIPV